METVISNCDFNLVNRNFMNIGLYTIDFNKYFNSLTSLELKNKSITKTEFLNILQQNYTIQLIDLSYNSINSLMYVEDLLVKNYYIHTLILSNNRLSNIQNFDIILLLNQTLQYLDLSNNNITDITPLNSIQDNVSLKTLILHHNKISIKNFNLGNNQTLKYLDLSYNKVSNTDFIGNNQSLTHLNLSNNTLTNIYGLQFNFSILYLNLSKSTYDNYHYNDLDLSPLTLLIKSNILEYLNLENVIFDNKTFIDMIKGNSSLYKLNLKNTNINVSLLDILEHNTTLTSLNLSDCRCYDLSFLSKIKNNSTLKKLNLHNCCLYKVSLKPLKGFLEHNTTLTSLNLSNNHICDETFLYALIKNTSLTELNLNRNNFNSLKPFEDIFTSNSTLSTLKLCIVSNRYAEYFKPLLLLKNNASLTSLHLEDPNYLREQCFNIPNMPKNNMILNILKTNTTLTELVI